MGSFFSGGSGKQGGSTTTTSSPDPTQQELNRLYAQTVRGVSQTTGGLSPFFTGFQGGATPTANFALSPEELSYRNLLMGATSNPTGLNASYGVLPQLQDIISRSLQPLGTNFQQPGLDVLKGRTDPTSLLAAAEKYMRDIGEPTARAASVAGGMGGVKGGAFQEALARQSSALALPIAQLVQQATGDYGQALMGRDVTAEQLGQARLGNAGRFSGMFPGIATGLDTARLANLQTGQEEASLPRLAGIQDFLRQQNLAVSALLGIPVMGGQTTTSTTRGNAEQGLTLMSLLGMLGPAAGAGLGAYAGAGGFSGGNPGFITTVR